jgi:hypothetical protein
VLADYPIPESPSRETPGKGVIHLINAHARPAFARQPFPRDACEARRHPPPLKRSARNPPAGRTFFSSPPAPAFHPRKGGARRHSRSPGFPPAVRDIDPPRFLFSPFFIFGPTEPSHYRFLARFIRKRAPLRFRKITGWRPPAENHPRIRADESAPFVPRRHPHLKRKLTATATVAALPIFIYSFLFLKEDKA